MTAQRVLFYSDMSDESHRAFSSLMETGILQRADAVFIVHIMPSPYRFHAEIVEPGLIMSLNPQLAEITETTLRERYGQIMESCQHASFHVLNGVLPVELLRFVRKQRVDLLILSLRVAQSRLPQIPGDLESILRKRCPCPMLFLAPGTRHGNTRAGETEPDETAPRKPPKVIHMDRYRLKQSMLRKSG